jgi:hypothetical protein
MSDQNRDMRSISNTRSKCGQEENPTPIGKNACENLNDEGPVMGLE